LQSSTGGDANAQLSCETVRLKQAMEVIELALELGERCPDGYLKAKPDVRRIWNQVFFQKVLVRSGRHSRAIYEEPFAYLLGTRTSLGSHKSKIVEVAGFELATVREHPEGFMASPHHPPRSDRW
jgi:hypothetical protein